MPTTSYRYWITYTGRFTSESTDEDRLRLEALDEHLSNTYPIVTPLVEVEEEIEGGKEG